MQKLRSIQALRGAAAIAVVIHHATDAVTLHGPGRFGAFGVDLFFVISGFIMATIAGDRTPLQFLSDRAWRIMPMWLIALAPWLLVLHPRPAVIAASIALWPIYGNAFHLPALGAGWTLGFEWVFYYGFALALATRAWVPALLFILCAVASVLMPGNALFAYLGSGMVAEFAFGVMVALLPRDARLALPLALLAISWLACAPLGTSGTMFGPMTWLRAGDWGVPAAMLVYAAVAAEARFAGRMFAMPIFFGDASYSIYLFHPLVAQLGSWPAGIALAIGVGSAGHLLIERPILTLRRRLHQRHSPAASDSAGIQPGDRFDLRGQSPGGRVQPSVDFDL